MQEMQIPSVYQLIRSFNRGEFRRKSIPQELVSGWPAIRRLGKTLCVTIPYYARGRAEDKTILYPLYCSATVPLGNPDMLLDYTVYPHQQGWQDLDWSKPVGSFPHEALAGIGRKEYQALCARLYNYYDEMVRAILQGKPFTAREEMGALFCRLMEPDQYSQYLRIDQRFYRFFCPI